MFTKPLTLIQPGIPVCEPWKQSYDIQVRVNLPSPGLIRVNYCCSFLHLGVRRYFCILIPFWFFLHVLHGGFSKNTPRGLSPRSKFPYSLGFCTGKEGTNLPVGFEHLKVSVAQERNLSRHGLMGGDSVIQYEKN